MRRATCLYTIVSLTLFGLIASGCSEPGQLRQQQADTSSSAPAPVPAVQEQQQPASIQESAADAAPLVRFPEWPLPGGPPPVNDSSQAKAPESPPPQPAAPIAVPPPAPKPEPKPGKAVKQPSKAAASQQSSKSKRLTLSQLVKKYPELLRLHGSTGTKKIALTFDDAPDTQFTPQVLDILKKYDVKATFFIVGRLAEKHPSVVKRIVKEGHTIGNHSYSHALLTKLSDEQYRMQINKTQTILKNTIGYSPKLLRPPYGEISESQLLWASDRHMLVVNWNVDSLDWKQLSQQQVMANILNHAKAGSIVLQHTGGGPNQDLSGTVNALPTIIESLRSKGYQLVTLPELLSVPKQL